MTTIITLQTGAGLGAAERDKLKGRLAGLRGVTHVHVVSPDRMVVTYENARMRLSTLTAASSTRDIKNISVNRK